MNIATLLILVIIGLFAGILSGFVGVGGGILVVPALVYSLGLTQHAAQGTSLALMIPPIGILAFYNYYQSGDVKLSYAAVIACTFVIGGYFGSKLSLSLPQHVVKLTFGLIMLYVAIKMIWSASKFYLK